MVNIILAFVTGLTTGGLSCLAVQGGLLASSLAGQVEKDVQRNAQLARGKKKGAKAAPAPAARPETAKPILAFLVAKLLAYTLLGFLLGLLGQMFQLSVYARAFLQIAIGIFMLGTALRMLNVHPIFRVFAFEPPAFLRRKLRRAAAENDGTSLAAPLFLGFLTVLIPCGVTQAMMAAAIGTADPFTGAALMAAFTLGTSPVFFAVAYFATQLGKRLEKNFMRFVAVVVLVLALVTIDSGITLAGSPVSFTRLFNGSAAQVEAAAPEASINPQGPAQPAASSSAADGREVTINVLNTGYNPRTVHAKSGEPVRLRLVTKGVYSCSLAFVIPSLGIEELLTNNGEAVIELPAQEHGARVPFSCSMGMFTGTIIFDL